MKKTMTIPCLVAVLFSISMLARAEDAADTLKAELKTAKIKINELEEQLYIATEGQQMEEPEAAENLAEGIYSWTQYVRRRPVGVLFPKTGTIPKGSVFGRFSHISQNQTFANSSKGNPFDDLLGLESRVKVGIMFGYGIMENWDVTVQRTNGRDYYGLDGKDHSYDLWDVMTKVKVLDERKHYVDLSVSGGFTYFWQDDNGGEYAGNAALLIEKSFWRFRFGSGLLYTSRSDWQQTSSKQSGALVDDKLYAQEDTFGSPRPENHTVAIPLSVSLALTKNIQLFGEAAFPTEGYQTHRGPSAAAGFRIDSHSHSYSLFLSNTSNNSFNSTLTGGYNQNRLDIFGFDISIFF